MRGEQGMKEDDGSEKRSNESGCHRKRVREIEKKEIRHTHRHTYAVVGFLCQRTFPLPQQGVHGGGSEGVSGGRNAL